MDKILEQKIIKDFPEFFKDKNDIQKSLMRFGFDHGNGWFDIVYKLTKDIKGILKDKDDFQLIQVKEKIGGLRYYFDLSTNEIKCRLPWGFNRFTKFRIQRFLDWIRYKLGLLSRIEKINDLVREAEHKSYQTCEECGAEGRVRNDIGWIRTLCINHYKEALSRRNLD